MSIEAGVLVDLDCNPIFWHLPKDRTGGSLPDSRELWDQIWNNRDRVLGFAHTHPGSGRPEPSYEDVTTFAAIEMALGKRLVWWIVSSDSYVDMCWLGPDKLRYGIGPCMYEPECFARLREESQYQNLEGGAL